MQRWASILLFGLVVLFGQGQAQTYAGLSTGLIADSGLTLGAQVGTAVTESFGVRAVVETNLNFSFALISAEAFYTPNPVTATWQGYYGGGLSVTWLASYDNSERVFVPLPTLTGGAIYRTRNIGFFGELHVPFLIFIPAPELRVGANYYF